MSWLDRLDAIEKDCRREGWDSYGADPVTPEAVAAAKAVCRSLDVVPGVNGEINVQLLSEAVQLTIDKTGRLASFYIDSEEAESQTQAWTRRA